jgi:pimeloyl-ACP methyl ester carboxylesterase
MEMSVPIAAVNGIEIAYETFGNGSRTVILLPGAGCQMLEWLDPFCEMIAEQDCTVHRVDTRDVGLSTHFDDICPNPGEEIQKLHNGEKITPPYTYSDMVDDVVALIAEIADGPVHVVGRSMGGMIGQRVATLHPDIIASLSSVASTSGNPELEVGDSKEVQEFFTLPAPVGREEQIKRAVDGDRLFSGTHFEFDEAADLKKRTDMRDRSDDSNGGMRHSLMFMTTDQVGEYAIHSANLRKLNLPVAVIHGSNDNLLNPAGAVDVAELIPNAKLTIVEGMSHELPSGAWPQIVPAILEVVDQAQPRK